MHAFPILLHFFVFAVKFFVFSLVLRAIAKEDDGGFRINITGASASNTVCMSLRSGLNILRFQNYIMLGNHVLIQKLAQSQAFARPSNARICFVVRSTNGCCAQDRKSVV